VTILLDSRQISRAIALLRRSQPVGLPTETVYGLAARALDEKSLARIFALKQRPHFDPLIVHVLDATWVPPLVRARGATHEKLMDAFWPGPLTLLFEKSDRVPDLCTAATPWVAIRSPSHPLFREVLRLMEEPLAAPSANLFGRISPTEARHVVEELGPRGLHAVLDGGACALGLESTVVKIHSESSIEVLRQGSLPIEALKSVLGPGVSIEVRASGSGVVEEAPGQLKSHYAPRTPLWLCANDGELSDLVSKLPTDEIALLSLGPMAPVHGVKKIEVLSASSSMEEAASRLFSTLRRLDHESWKALVALEMPAHGLGPAMNDRLRRAAHGSRLP